MNNETALAAAFGVIHRTVGRAKELVGGRAVTRRRRDADTDTNPCRRGKLERLRNPGNDPPGDFCCLVVCNVRQQDDKFVAANAAYEIGIADAGLQAVCDGDKNGIACGMSEPVVDALEAVEIKAEDGEFRA
jgi:hypothetical protein